MITFTERAMGRDEHAALERLLPGEKTKWKRFGVVFGMAFTMPLLAILAMAKGGFLHSASGAGMALLFFIIALAVAAVIYRWEHNVNGDNDIRTDLQNGKVLDIYLEPERVWLFRGQPGAPNGYAVGVRYRNELCCYFMQGDYVRKALEEMQFPRSSMLLSFSQPSHRLIDFNASGDLLQIEVSDLTLNFQDYWKDDMPRDGAFFSLSAENA